MIAAGDDRGTVVVASPAAPTFKKPGDPYLLSAAVNDTKLANGVLQFAVLPEFGRFPSTDFNLNVRLITFGPDGKFLGDNVGAVFSTDLLAGQTAAPPPGSIVTYSKCFSDSVISSGGAKGNSQVDIIFTEGQTCDSVSQTGGNGPLTLSIPFVINQDLADGSTIQLEVYGTQTGNSIPLDKTFKDNVVRATVIRIGNRPQLNIWSDHYRFGDKLEVANTAATPHNVASGVNTAIAAGPPAGNTRPRYFTDFTTGSDNIIGTLEFVPPQTHSDLRYTQDKTQGLQAFKGQFSLDGFDQGWQNSGLLPPRLELTKCTGSTNGVSMTFPGPGLYTTQVNDGAPDSLALTGLAPVLVAVCAYEDTLPPSVDGDGSDGEIYSFTAAGSGVFGGFPSTPATRNMESIDRDAVGAFLVPWVASGTQSSGANAFSANVIRISNIGYQQASQSLHMDQGNLSTDPTGSTGQTPYGSNASSQDPNAWTRATATAAANINTAGFFPVDGGRVFARLLNAQGANPGNGATPGGNDRFAARFNRSIASGIAPVGNGSIGQTVLLAEKVPAGSDMVVTSADLETAFGFNFVRGDLLILVENSSNEVYVDRRVTSGASAFWQPVINCATSSPDAVSGSGSPVAGFGQRTVFAQLCGGVAGAQGATTPQTGAPGTDPDIVLPAPLPHVTDPSAPNNIN